MYTKYYGFNEKPFTLTPNPRFMFLSKNHREAFAHLLFGINNHYGFIELVGEVGTGKTTVLRSLLCRLGDDTYRSALIFNPCMTGVELFRSINHEFGLQSGSEYISELLEELNSFLLRENARGVTVVLIIDEAQNLSPTILEQLRLISNFETENDKLIQIVLAGQPELSTLLGLPELRQLNQRITVRYRLLAMDGDDTRSYVHHRMVVAGETGGVSFNRTALALIQLYSRGIPRLINNLCDRALLVGYGDERRIITARIVTRAIVELVTVQHGRRLFLATIGMVTVVAVCLGAFLSLDYSGRLSGNQATTGSPRQSPPQVHSVIPAKAAVVTSPPAPSPARGPNPETAVALPIVTEKNFSQLQREILSFDQNDVHLRAFNTIADVWGAGPNDRSRTAVKKKLRVTIFRGTLAEAIRFDLPFLVLTKVTGRMGGYCIAVTSTGNNSVSISPSLFGKGTLTKNELNSIASGTFYLVWQNSNRIPDDVKQGNSSNNIKELQRLLQRSGAYSGPIDGGYGAATVKAVSDFQRSAGIAHNETVGELTLAALSRYDTTIKIPSLSSVGNSK